MFEGKAVKLNQLDNGVVELVFDYVEESVNKFDRTALQEWRTVLIFYRRMQIPSLDSWYALPKVSLLLVLISQSLEKLSSKQ